MLALTVKQQIKEVSREDAEVYPPRIIPCLSGQQCIERCRSDDASRIICPARY
jgi:hypothetical protein